MASIRSIFITGTTFSTSIEWKDKLIIPYFVILFQFDSEFAAPSSYTFHAMIHVWAIFSRGQKTSWKCCRPWCFSEIPALPSCANEAWDRCQTLLKRTKKRNGKSPNNRRMVMLISLLSWTNKMFTGLLGELLIKRNIYQKFMQWQLHLSI